jgi:phage gpG-like protein
MAKRGFNHLGAVASAIPRASEDMVERITTDIAARAGATAPIDTGALAESYHADVDGLTGIAGTNMEYGPHVEYGTIHTNAQPHIVPAANEVENNMATYAHMMGKELTEAARTGRG